MAAAPPPRPAARPGAVRTVLVTGAPGAGRTVVATATALRAAREGARTLLLTEEPTAAGASAAGTPWSAPERVAPGLWVARIDVAGGAEERLVALQERYADTLELLGAAPLAAEELTPLPGARELALLDALTALHEAPAAGGGTPATGGEASGAVAGAGGAAGAGAVTGDRGTAADSAGGWDVAVVDLPAASVALGALALPEQLLRYLRRLLPPERQAARALRPLLAQLAGVPAPAQRLYEAAGRGERRLEAAREAVQAQGVTVRLVFEPTPSGARELRRTRAACALQGCAVEAVIANRVLPTGSDDAWLADVAQEQQDVLKQLRADLAADTAATEPDGESGVAEGRAGPDGGAGAAASGGPARTRAEPPPGGTGGADGAGRGGPGTPGGLRGAVVALCELPHLGREPQGPDGLAPLVAALPPPAGPPSAAPWTVDDLLATEGALRYRLPLPGADRGDVTLIRRGHELVLTVAGHRRVLPLPSALRRCTIARARLDAGELRIRFVPDPAVWPEIPPER